MMRVYYVLPEIRADPGEEDSSAYGKTPVIRSEGDGETEGFMYAGAYRRPRFRLRRVLRAPGRYCTA